MKPLFSELPSNPNSPLSIAWGHIMIDKIYKCNWLSFIKTINLLFLIIGSLVFSIQLLARPKLGVIRWDYFFEGSPYSPLITPEWDNRRPFFALRAEDGSIIANADKQNIVDDELLEASQAGISFFAYVNYLGYDDDGLSFAPNKSLKFHLQSQYKEKVQFSLILSPEHLGLKIPINNKLPNNQIENWNKTKNIIFARLNSELYYKVDQKPIIFFLGFEKFTSYWTSQEEANLKIKEFKEQIVSQLKMNPVFVAMVWSDYHWNQLLGLYPPEQNDNKFIFDAVSSYANSPQVYARDENGEDWGKKNIELNYEDSKYGCKAKDILFRNSFTDTPVIPTVTSGWDERPLKGRDPYWDRNPNHSWCSHASPSVLSNHIKETMDWITIKELLDQGRGNAASKLSLNSVLIYAWNEYLEGGFIAPMALEGRSRLNAIETMITEYKSPNPINTKNGMIHDTPDFCNLVGNNTTCSVKIKWKTFQVSKPGLFLRETEQLVSGSPNGSYTANYINSNGYHFDLRENFRNPNSKIIASIFIVGKRSEVLPPPMPLPPPLPPPLPIDAPSGFIKADSESCKLINDLTCTVVISWRTSNVAKPGLFLRESGQLVGGTKWGTYVANYINSTGYHFDLRENLHDISSQVLDSVFIQGTNDSLLNSLDLF